MHALKWSLGFKRAQCSTTSLNGLNAHGSLQSAHIGIFSFVNVCIHFILGNVLVCRCLTFLVDPLAVTLTTVSIKHVNDFILDFVATELINKLNFLEDEDRDAPPSMSTNPFDEPDDDIHPNHLNPFGDPDEEGVFNYVSM